MADNQILPFQLQSSPIRGRIVRLGSTLDDILTAHKYPDEVLRVTGETAVLCAMLSAMLKYEGIFTLQVQGDGPVSMVVADMTSVGQIRACAAFKESVPAAGSAEPLFGKAYLAFTVDQGQDTERYQGIVELVEDSLAASVRHYFSQSEQLGTGLVIAIGQKDGRWRGAGIILQQMPQETSAYNSDENSVDEDDWRRAMILLSSVKDEEMLDPALTSEDLLYRLFHEEGVVVFEPQKLQKSCRCSAERVKTILGGMPPEDLRDMTVDGKIVMTCEFCSTDYAFDPADINQEVTT